MVRRECFKAAAGDSIFVLNVDLHCHSNASDGMLSAAEVVRRAAADGVGLLALTDHDTLAGLPAAAAAARETGIGWVSGVEISIEWRSVQVHILGLDFDYENPALNAGLARIRSGRIERARRMGEALAEAGIEGAFEGAMRHAEHPELVSRSHFARYLVEKGICRDHRRVFDEWMVPGKPGYVDHRWAGLEEALEWIHGASGVAVVAHPGRYLFSSAALKQFFRDFKTQGGEGIEVVSGGHTREQSKYFSRLAKHFGFSASRGSDFHGPGESCIGPGALDPLPEGLTPVWSLFRESFLEPPACRRNGPDTTTS
ncbi:MAG: PHP domain-containing protein [Betaproteobacteria bacterium]|nr:PHP domain-containing protein [Betaproteobacteria bacterium]